MADRIVTWGIALLFTLPALAGCFTQGADRDACERRHGHLEAHQLRDVCVPGLSG